MFLLKVTQEQSKTRQHAPSSTESNAAPWRGLQFARRPWKVGSPGLLSDHIVSFLSSRHSLSLVLFFFRGKSLRWSCAGAALAVFVMS